MDTMVSGRAGMSEAEWKARCDLAALYRITDLFGWTDTIDTHMSVRIPGEPDCFLINNYGDLFNEITADCSGVIAEVCVQNKEFVEYGTVLFRVDPNA